MNSTIKIPTWSGKWGGPGRRISWSIYSLGRRVGGGEVSFPYITVYIANS